MLKLLLSCSSNRMATVKVTGWQRNFITALSPSHRDVYKQIPSAAFNFVATFNAFNNSFCLFETSNLLLKDREINIWM